METTDDRDGGRSRPGRQSGGGGPGERGSRSEAGSVRKIEKSDAEWREELTEEEFRIAREGGTERAFTGRYWDTKAEGVYRCVCCGTALFTSDEKYDSGSGWPSFRAPVEEGSVRARDDHSLGMRRTEVLCAACDAHLGHVFPDGPGPTGLRYCVNSASLDLDEAGEEPGPGDRGGEGRADGADEAPRSGD